MRGQSGGDTLTLAPTPVRAATTTAEESGAVRPVRVLLVDGKPLVREGLGALLEHQPGVAVVPPAADLAGALAAPTEPDVIVVDIVLPDARGTEVVGRLRERFARAGILVLSNVEARAEVELSIAAGADAYVPKRATTEELLDGIRHAAAGRRYVHHSLAAAPDAVAGTAPETADRGISSLTSTEREVVRLLVLGHTNAEIAAISSVSLRTIEARRARALRKLGVRTRAELVRVAPHLAGGEIGLA